MLRKLLLTAILLSGLYTTEADAQPEINPHFIACYDTVELGYLTPPGLGSRNPNPGTTWQVIVSTQDDVLDPVSLDSATLGMPTGDDVLVFQGQGVARGWSLVATVLPRQEYVGRPVFARVFEMAPFTPGIHFTESYRPGEMSDPETSHFSFIPIFSYDHGGHLDMLLDTTGIPVGTRLEQLDPSDTDFSYTIEDFASLDLETSEDGLDIRYIQLKPFIDPPSDWVMSDQPFPRALSVSMEYLDRAYWEDEGEYELSLFFTSEELDTLYDGALEPEDLAIYRYRGYTNHPWEELETVILTGMEPYRARYSQTYLPLFGRFVLAPSGLTDREEEAPSRITSYRLHSAYPNPFNPTTILTLDLPQARPAVLDVYNMLGRRVATVHQGPLPQGRHEFTFDATDLASGVYFAVARAGSFHAVQKLVVLK